ncbi:MAG TPA: chemotaxis protein CheB, partial [Casimicrobiaceae bacterium]
MDMKTDPKTAAQAEAPRVETRSAKPGHDIVVIGGSAGAIEALVTITSALPSNLAASIFVVVHRGTESPPLLAQVLRRNGGLSTMEAVDLLPIERGMIYVAQPDRHLLVEENSVRVVRGPKENRHRPAIDPLFRSA